MLGMGEKYDLSLLKEFLFFILFKLTPGLRDPPAFSSCVMTLKVSLHYVTDKINRGNSVLLVDKSVLNFQSC